MTEERSFSNHRERKSDNPRGRRPSRAGEGEYHSTRPRREERGESSGPRREGSENRSGGSYRGSSRYGESSGPRREGGENRSGGSYRGSSRYGESSGPRREGSENRSGGSYRGSSRYGESSGPRREGGENRSGGSYRGSSRYGESSGPRGNRDFSPKKKALIESHLVSAEDAGINLSSWFSKHVGQGMNKDKINFFASKDAIRSNGDAAGGDYVISAGDKITFPKHILEEKEQRERGEGRDEGRRFPRSEEERGFRRKEGFSKERRVPGEGRYSERRGNYRAEEKGDVKNTPKYQLLLKKAESWIICRDDNVLAINKPAGLASQGGSNIDVSLDDIMVDVFESKNLRPKLVHRLDIDTSGVLLLAMSGEAVRELGAAFQDREMKKKYVAVLCGRPKDDEGTITYSLTKDSEGGDKESIYHSLDGKEAVTNYKVLSSNDKFSLVEFDIETGRTHQIRVHSALIGCPVLGDRKYGTKRRMYDEGGEYLNNIDFYINEHKNSKFMQLHSQSVAFNLFDRNYQISAPLPWYMESLVKEIKGQKKDDKKVEGEQ